MTTPKRTRLLMVAAVLLIALAAYGVLTLWRNQRAASGGLRLTGHNEATETNLGFKVPGKIRVIHFEEGQWIKTGQVVAGELEADDLRQEVASAEARLKAAQANLTNSLKKISWRCSASGRIVNDVMR